MGHITTLTKNLRLKSRIFSEGSQTLALTVQQNSLMVLHPRDIAFGSLTEAKMSSVFCEGSFTDEYTFVDFAIERFRTQQPYLYGLTKANEIIIFDFRH